MKLGRCIAKGLVAVLLLCLLSTVSSLPDAKAAGSFEVKVSLFIFGTTLANDLQDGRCTANQLQDEGPYFNFGSDRRILQIGKWVVASASPVGTAGCLFDLTFRVPVESSEKGYAIAFYGQDLGILTKEDIARNDRHVEIGVTTGANPTRLEVVSRNWRLPEWPTPTPEPTSVPVPTSTPWPSPTPVSTPISGKIGGSDTYRIVGSFELFGKEADDFASLGPSGCTGIGGYSDIATGQQVIIRNQSGDIIATSQFEPDPTASSKDCRFVFVAEVPDATFYSFEIGRRGELAYSKQEMEDNDWRVEFALGD